MSRAGLEGREGVKRRHGGCERRERAGSAGPPPAPRAAGYTPLPPPGTRHPGVPGALRRTSVFQASSAPSGRRCAWKV